MALKTQNQKKEYPFDTGLNPVKESNKPSPFICGSCGNEEYPGSTLKGECTRCSYRILYKKRPRYEVWHKAR